MLFFHTVQIDVQLKRVDPLYVGNFFSLERMRWSVRKRKQQMIFSVAFAWYKLVKKQLKYPGFLEEEILLTHLTKTVKDARKIVEKFFDITSLGYNMGDGVNYAATQVSPKRLGRLYIEAIERQLHNITFHPGLPPTNKNLIQTTVSVRRGRSGTIKRMLKEEGREDLLAMVDWLLQQEDDIVFYYKPSGRLQARDTSVYPIRAIELWPGWLRSELFGTTIDLENSFCQYLVSNLEKKHARKPELLTLKYPDIVKAVYDKQKFREDLCAEVLRRPLTSDNITLVKKLMMALANGSNASSAMMLTDSRSEACAIVRRCAPDLLPSEASEVGDRLQKIAKQFRNAKRELCIYLLGEPPNRENMKRVFEKYFDWEKHARYAIWNAVGQTGLMIHDGLDGVKTTMGSAELTAHIARETNLRVSADVL